MKTKHLITTSILFIALVLATTEIVLFQLTGNHLLNSKQDTSYFTPNVDCTKSQKIERKNTSDPQLKAVSDYERVCNSAFLDGMMLFTNMPVSVQNANESADHMTQRLKEFSSFNLLPLVIIEPDSEWGLIDFEEYASGYYDQWIETYFARLKSNGITDKQLGTWVPFPEPQQDFWNNSTPESFAASANRYLKSLRKYFPDGKTGLLLDSQTGQSDQIPQLLAYIRLVENDLVDVAGIQGFPWDPIEEGDSRMRVTLASDFAPSELAKEVADSLGTKNVLFNIGTYRHRKGENGGDIAVTTALRKASLDSIIEETQKMSNYNIIINIFAENKYNVKEGVDWSYWQPGDVKITEQMKLFTNFVNKSDKLGYSLYLYDSRQ